MKPTLVKKNTKGGSAGLSWEAGEVKELHPTLAEELVILSPDDYEIVQEGEHTPAPPAHNPPGIVFPAVSTDGTGIVASTPETTNVEVPVKPEADEKPKVPAKPKNTTKKSSKTTETPSAE